MVEIKKAIENLQGIKSARFATVTDNLLGTLYEKIVLEDIESLDLAIVLLEKQIPKKPKERFHSTYEQYEPSYAICECGCRMGISQTMCQHCGQAVEVEK